MIDLPVGMATREMFQYVTTNIDVGMEVYEAIFQDISDVYVSLTPGYMR